MLYDFYGELLTDRQKEFFDYYYNDDLSLSEIAENAGISRQGVRDVIVRAEAIMARRPDLFAEFDETQLTTKAERKILQQARAEFAAESVASPDSKF